MAHNTPQQLAETLRKHLLAAIEGGADLEISLRAARAYGKALQKVDCGRLADPELEDALLDRFHTLDLQGDGAPSFEDLHVASEVYDLGGHTKILETLASCGVARGRSQRILFTRGTTERHRKAMTERGISVDVVQGSETERALAVFRAGLSSRCLTLHIHPDDIGAAVAAAALREVGVRILFVNHADHSFVFGTSAADVVLEVSGTGWNLTQRHRPHRAQSFLGIPIRPLFDAPNPDPDPIIVTVGSANKYRPATSGHSFQDIARDILEHSPARLAVVGTDGVEPWWDELRGSFADRIIFHGRKNFDDMRAILSRANCYIDSIPWTGGTIFSEASMSGLPVFGLVTGAGGYSVLDKIRYAEPTAMIAAVVASCSNLKPDPIQNAARGSLRAVASPDTVVDRFTAARNGAYEVLPREMERALSKPLALSADELGGSRFQIFRSILRPDLFRIFGGRMRSVLTLEIFLADGLFSALRTKMKYLKALYRMV